MPRATARTKIRAKAAKSGASTSRVEPPHAAPLRRNRLLAEVVHPDDTAAPRTRRTVTVNRAESAIEWLFARGMISARQHCAGQKLRAAFDRAGLSPRTTVRWDAVVVAPGGSARARGADAAMVAAMDAADQFRAGLDAVGPGLADLCWRVICVGDGMALAEREMGWPARSGRVVLTLALDRLADWYRIPHHG